MDNLTNFAKSLNLDFTVKMSKISTITLTLYNIDIHEYNFSSINYLINFNDFILSFETYNAEFINLVLSKYEIYLTYELHNIDGEKTKSLRTIMDWVNNGKDYNFPDHLIKLLNN
jgi:hypothetical protein